MNAKPTTNHLNGTVATIPAELSQQTPSSSEVVPKAKRRTFSSDYKRRILKEADQATERGAVGALLRREGLYSSHLTDWRRQAAAGELGRNKRGRKTTRTAEQKETARLLRENQRLQQQLAQAELIIEAQKKVGDLLTLLSQQKNGGQ